MLRILNYIENDMKITPRRIYDFVQARIEQRKKVHYEKKAMHYIEQSSSSIVGFVKENQSHIIPGGEILSYILSTRYRDSFDMENRYLPYRWLSLSNKVYELTKPKLEWHSGPSVLVFGAGNRNPYTLALFFLLQGASKVYCLEPSSIDTPDVMSRLYETVCQITFGLIEGPHKRSLDDISKFIDIKALAMGDYSNVIKDNCIEVLKCVGEDITLPNESIDLIYSRSVLEHVVDIDKVYKENLRIISPTGHMVHDIGLCSHNKHDPITMYYNPLPELAEFDHLNKKRLSDHVRSIEALGMRATVLDVEKCPLHDQEVLPEFKAYSKEDLEVISAVVHVEMTGLEV